MATNTRRWQALNERLKDNEQPITMNYVFSDVDFGTVAGNLEIEPIPGKTGKLVAIQVSDVSEAFANDLTEAVVHVGTAGDADGYAISDGITDLLALRDSENLTWTEGALGSILDGDTTIEVLPVAGTDGTATAGIATLTITIIWV